VLLTRVEYVKPGAAKNFLVVDAAMNDLIRAPLYGAWHEVKTVRESAPAPAVYDIVGPVCESGDFLAQDRRLGAKEGDLLAILSAGAYGMAMSSNYNSRPARPKCWCGASARPCTQPRNRRAIVCARTRSGLTIARLCLCPAAALQ